MAFDFAKCNRPAHRFGRGKINSGPIPFLCGRIWISGPNYSRDPDDSFVVAAVIEKDFIALLHSTKIVAGRVIAYASPTGLAFRDKVRPRIRGWFLFHEPKIFHQDNVAQASKPVGPAGILPAEPILSTRDARGPTSQGSCAMLHIRQSQMLVSQSTSCRGCHSSRLKDQRVVENRRRCRDWPRDWSVPGCHI